MPAAAPVDKARQAAIARLDAAWKELDESYKCFGQAADALGATKDMKTMRMRADKAKADTGPNAAKAIAALVKDVQALKLDFDKRVAANFAASRRIELTGIVNGKLAGALLAIGKIQDPVLTRMMFAEQAATRARMDKAEMMKKDIDAVSDMDDLDDEMPALEKRIEAALKVSSWLAANYRVMRQLVEKGVQAVASDRCRKLLMAELDFVEQAKNDALPKLDAKAVQAATLPGLRMVQKVAARLVAETPAMDRELMRVGQAIKAAGVPAELLARLRKLAEEKAKGFPTAREAQALEGAMDAFSKQLVELAKAAQKLPAAA